MRGDEQHFGALVRPFGAKWAQSSAPELAKSHQKAPKTNLMRTLLGVLEQTISKTSAERSHGTALLDLTSIWTPFFLIHEIQTFELRTYFCKSTKFQDAKCKAKQAPNNIKRTNEIKQDQPKDRPA